ncbi:ATP-dependent helicase [Citricoccus muralis]|uniref:DNA 3'-5' helicase n=1 Tax=Citricoccus muralis TaxID=169134 RepID=A0ABY8H3F6_9MICC|nr:UrvD/REP family ATP-dependent DNA helicase [Citricoccus muralis]WFP15666.1 PD-(D/E)XK nuclease family protein [Citricoccus muralis]
MTDVPLSLTTTTESSAPRPELDAEQRGVVELAPGHGPTLVLGAPGTGRTTVALEYAVERIRRGDEVLMLTGSRQGADRLRDRLTARLTHEGLGTRAGSPVRSYASYAFDLLRRMRADGFLPHLNQSPRLLSGAEQDRVIAELIEGYRAEPDFSPEWPDSLRAAVGLDGFRREVRELIDRTSEYGVDPGRLRDLGVEQHREEWVAAARLLQDYRDVLDLGRADAFDPAGLITSACRLWDEHPEFAEQERARLGVIVVDDLQNVTPAIHQLILRLATDRDAVLTADPDVTVEGFRGARPQLVGEYPQALISGDLSAEQRGERIHRLRTGYRMRPDVHEAWARAARRLPAVPGLPDYRGLAVPIHTAERCSETDVHWVATELQQRLLILQQVLDVHHREQVPLSRIAVLARTGSAVAEIGRFLESEGVPVRRTMADTVLNREPAVTPLLRLVELTEPNAEPAEEIQPHAGWLITGRYGGSSALHLRRLRQRLLAVARDREDHRNSSALLSQLLTDPESFHDLLALNPEWSVPDYARGAHRIARMLTAAARAAGQPESTAETVLWAAWDAVRTDVAARWEADALSADAVASRRADRDLDAVVALFEAAERYVDQFPGRSAHGFVEYLEQQQLPMDSLSTRAVHAESVTVLTPSSAAGQEWDVVILAGVQDGVWPNTRLRGQLLHTQHLVDMVTGRSGQTTYTDQLAEVRADEMRTFCAALSRARHRLIGIAVNTEDAQPSPFLDVVSPWNDHTAARELTKVADPLTEAALVASLRRTLETGGDSELNDAAIAATVLAQQSVSGADPDSWWGLAPLSTEQPVQGPGAVEDDDAIHLSPSTVETALNSPLQWFIQQVGGRGGSTLAMSLGTLIHSIAEDHPAGTLDELINALDARFASLGLDPGWEADQLRVRCESMLGFFADYVRDMRQQGRTLVATEQRVTVDERIGDVHLVLRGSIDRLEATADGRSYVVDLKTGTNPPTAKELEQLPQLGVYQTMLRSQALTGLDDDVDMDLPHRRRPAGAALVQLGSTTKNLKIQEQAAVTDDDTWAENQLVQAAGLVAGPTYLAVHRPGKECRLGALCPLCDEGKQITVWNR